MIKSMPYFSVEPSSGSILPGATVQVVVKYHPKALGKHTGKIPIKVGHPAGLWSLGEDRDCVLTTRMHIRITGLCLAHRRH